MPFYFFIWDGENESHIAEHGITPDEFEAVVCDPEVTDISRSTGRPIAFAHVNGRYIACVYALIDDSTVYPITVFETRKS